MTRVTKHEYYFELAKTVSTRATCLRRKFGAVIVKNDEVISTGYNGSPRQRLNCDERGICLREELNIPSGERYDMCRSVHAETNAIISAARKDMIGATMYLYGWDVIKEEPCIAKPCIMCERVLINSGIEDIWLYSANGKHQRVSIRDYIFNEDILHKNAASFKE